MTERAVIGVFAPEANAGISAAEVNGELPNVTQLPEANGVALQEPRIAKPFTGDFTDTLPNTPHVRIRPSIKSPTSIAGLLLGAEVMGSASGDFTMSGAYGLAGVTAATVYGAVRWGLSIERRDAVHEMQELVGERFEIFRAAENKAYLRWHPTKGQDPIEGIQRTVAWAANSDVGLLALPGREVRKLIRDPQGAVSWAEKVVHGRRNIRPRKGKGAENDEVFVASPKEWVERLGMARTKTVSERKYERHPVSIDILGKMRELDPDNRYVAAYDACPGGHEEKREIVRQMARTEVLRGLDRPERRRTDRVENRSERVSILGQISNIDPLKIVWNDPVGGPYAESVASVLGVDAENYDVWKALKLKEGELPGRETMNLLTYHLYAAAHNDVESESKGWVTHDVEVYDPPAMPQKIGVAKTAHVSPRERAYEENLLYQWKRRAAAMGLTAVIGVGLIPLGHGISDVLHHFASQQTISGTLEGGVSAAPQGPDYADWSLQPHGMSTIGYWTQMTSNRLSADGTWLPDFQYIDGQGPAQLPTEIPPYYTDYIKVTDEESSLSSALVAPDPDNQSNEVVMVPILQGTEIVGASIDGKPVSAYLTDDYTAALSIPDTTPGDAKLTYWVAPEREAMLPSAYDSISTAGKIDTQAIADMWAARGIPTTLQGDNRAYAIANSISSNGHYTLTPSTLLAQPGKDWSPVLSQWVENGEEANCQVASTAEVISNPEDNIADGYYNATGKDVLDTHHAHQWAVSPGGEIIDATPSTNDPATEAYFNEAPVSRTQSKSTWQKIGDFLKSSTAEDSGIALGGLATAVGGLVLYHRRKQIAAKWHADSERRTQHREADRHVKQLAKQEKRVDKIPEHVQRAGYLLLGEVKHGMGRPDLRTIRRNVRREDSVSDTWRRELKGRYDLTADIVPYNLNKVARRANGTQDKRTVKAAHQILRLAELRQRNTVPAPRADLVEA